jgi:pimeloyl-ACP methyl ester carboxylesterase
MMPFIESNNKDKLKIYYDIYCEDQDDTVVLIHPIGGNIEIWNNEISLISKKNLRIIAYELRGHNRSNMGTSNSFIISDLVNDLEKLLDKLSVKKCTLIGHSIGGSIASLYAKKYPQNIEAIIFINASSVRIPDRDLEKHFTTRKIALTQGMDALAEWIRHETRESENAFKDENKWIHFKEIFTKTSREGFVAATNSLYSMPEDVTVSLREAKYKIFGIVGERDEVFMKLMHKMKDEIPRFKLKIIESSDHWVIAENPEALDRALNEFLDEIYV